MQGLIYLGVAAVYLALVFLLARWAWRAVRKAGGSVGKAVAATCSGVLAMWLPAFWNLLPTATAHRSACQRDAGFQAFVAPEAWIASHQEALKRLEGLDLSQQTSAIGRTPSGFVRYNYLGGLLALERQVTRTQAWGLGLGRLEMRIVDAASQQVLARAVDYGLGTREDARVWLIRASCFPDDARPFSRLTAFDQELKEALK